MALVGPKALPMKVMNEPVEGCARENWARVLPRKAMATPGGDDGERRGDAGGEREKAEAEVEAHRRRDVGHGRRGDIDGAEHAAHEPLGLARHRLGRRVSAGRERPLAA